MSKRRSPDKLRRWALEKAFPQYTELCAFADSWEQTEADRNTARRQAEELAGHLESFTEFEIVREALTRYEESKR